MPQRARSVNAGPPGAGLRGGAAWLSVRCVRPVACLVVDLDLGGLALEDRDALGLGPRDTGRHRAPAG